MTTKIALLIYELHRSESILMNELLRVADRHQTDHEVYHVARDLARWSRQHVAELAEAGRERHLKLDPHPHATNGLAGWARRRQARALGRLRAPGMLLLADLRHIVREASGVSTDWLMLAQAAQATRDETLLGLVSRSHPETLRQIRWANAKLKESAAQVLVS